MAYHVLDNPGGYKFAPCLLKLGQQIAASPRYGPFLTNLGQAPDQAHISQGSDSDHNPWLYNMIRAFDFGGPLPLLYELRDWLNVLYGQRDHRIFAEGYTNGPDRYGTDWDNPGKLHIMGGNDEGHLHVSATRDLAGLLDISDWPLPLGPSQLPPLTPGDDSMSAADVAQLTALINSSTAGLFVELQEKRAFNNYRDLDRNDGLIALMNPGVYWEVPNVDYLILLQNYRWTGATIDVKGDGSSNIFNFFRDLCLSFPRNNQVMDALDALKAIDLSKIDLGKTAPLTASEVADEMAKRLQS